jgi:hypothetical protein
MSRLEIDLYQDERFGNNHLLHSLNQKEHVQMRVEEQMPKSGWISGCGGVIDMEQLIANPMWAARVAASTASKPKRFGLQSVDISVDPVGHTLR